MYLKKYGIDDDNIDRMEVYKKMFMDPSGAAQDNDTQLCNSIIEEMIIAENFLQATLKIMKQL